MHRQEKYMMSMAHSQNANKKPIHRPKKTLKEQPNYHKTNHINPKTMTIQQQQAKSLFFNSNLTQCQIAEIVGINRKPLYDWIRKEKWSRSLRDDELTPMRIVRQYYSQLETLNYKIADSNASVPNPDDLRVIKTLTAAIKTLTPKQPRSQVAATMTDFLTHIVTADPDLREALKPHLITFLQAKDPNAEIPDTFTPCDQDVIENLIAQETELVPERTVDNSQPPSLEEEVKYLRYVKEINDRMLNYHGLPMERRSQENLMATLSKERSRIENELNRPGRKWGDNGVTQTDLQIMSTLMQVAKVAPEAINENKLNELIPQHPTPKV